MSDALKSASVWDPNCTTDLRCRYRAPLSREESGDGDGVTNTFNVQFVGESGSSFLIGKRAL